MARVFKPFVSGESMFGSSELSFRVRGADADLAVDLPGSCARWLHA
jgi:hypothetical protein